MKVWAMLRGQKGNRKGKRVQEKERESKRMEHKGQGKKCIR